MRRATLSDTGEFSHSLKIKNKNFNGAKTYVT